MQININGKNIELTDEIRDYATKRATNLEKLLSRIEKGDGRVMVNFDLGKATNHHKSGEIFHADCRINIDGKEFYASADGEDLHQAIDEIKDVLYLEINKDKDRTQTLFHRGARSVKKMLKGLSKRNPFTSKY